MDQDHFHELVATENSYWWNVAKRELAVDLLRRHFPPPARLVEAGVGAAGNLTVFRALGYDVRGLDMLPGSVDRARGLGLNDVRVHDIEQPWPLKHQSADVIVMLDVLEHLREPAIALQHAAEVLTPGGGVLVTVPAGPWLMSPWDDMLGHHRRYTPSMLRTHAAAAGLRVAWLSHWNSFSLPPAAVLRLSDRWLRRRKSAEFPRVPAVIGELLLQCARVERAVMRKMPIPCGLSLVAVLTR